MKIRVATTILENDVVSQEATITEDNGKIILPVMKFLVETREHQIRDALIKIGWQPPKEI